MPSDNETHHIAEAIAAFRAAAISKGDFSTPKSKDHKLHKIMADEFRCLIGFGPEGIFAFRALLSDESPHVRLWVTAQLLSEGDGSVAPILEAFANERSPLGFNAKMTLKEYQTGRLRSPYGINPAK